MRCPLHASITFHFSPLTESTSNLKQKVKFKQGNQSKLFIIGMFE